ncbi:unnamed protein product [Cunninghamella blakesleeana]
MVSIWIYFILSTLFILLTEGHSKNNQKLNRIEPITNIKLDISTSSSQHDQHHQLLNKRTIHDVEYEDKIRLQFDGFGRSFFLHLEPNVDLFHPNAIIYHSSNLQQEINPTDYRIYKGNVIHSYYSNQTWKHEQVGILPQDEKILGWARIILRNDLLEAQQKNQPIFEGSFSLLNDIYHIKTFESYHKTKRSDDPTLKDFSNMILYRDSDISTFVDNKNNLSSMIDSNKKPSGQCGFNQLNFNQYNLHQHTKDFSPSSSSSIGLFSPFQDLSFQSSPFHHRLNKRVADGCPTTKKIAYIGAAADCTYTKYYKTKQQAALQIINDFNSASAVYESSFNIQLGLVNITVMDEICPDDTNSTTATNTYDSPRWNQKCSQYYTLEKRLSDFSQWRGSMSDDGIALWHLITNCATGIEVGIAWVSQLCNSDLSTQTSSGSTEYVSGAGVSSIVRDEWKVIAHEIGHGFGAIHDCTSGDCPCSGSNCECCPLSSTTCDAGGNYIMNPTSNVTYDKFSPCSISTICNVVSSMGSCLQDPGARITKALNMCGNGVVEEGEECDPGDKSSSCCDASTCKFINNAVCDDANDACCNQCQFQPSTYQCRPATSNCDIPEYCSGSSGSCPKNTYRTDGESCGTNGLVCASGQCTSRSLQCQYRGSTLNITRACPNSNSCQLSCSNPSGTGCLSFNGYVIDGTPCGSLNGKCRTGTCDEGSINDRALYWLSNNKQIAIPVGVALFLIILGSILSCCWFGCCGIKGCRHRKKINKSTTPQSVPPVHNHNQMNPHHSTSPLPPTHNQMSYHPTSPLVQTHNPMNHHHQHPILSLSPSPPPPVPPHNS